MPRNVPVPLLIDTYNVLHVTGVLPPEIAGVDVTGLARLIAQSRYRSEDVCLLCDGASRGVGAGSSDSTDEVGQTTSRIRVMYAGAGRSADDLIIQLINKSSAPKRLIVVSSDRRIRQAAARRRCHDLPSDEFLSQLARDIDLRRSRGRPKAANDSKPPGLLPEKHIDAWIEQFGLDEDDLTRPAAEPLSNKQEKKELTLDDLDSLDMGKILGEGEDASK